MPSEARKRELKEQYKAMRPEMGVFVFRCVPTGKNYVGWTHDLKGTLNSLRFQLELGSCREKALQEAWRVHGGAAFCVDVLEKLPIGALLDRLPFGGREDKKTDKEKDGGKSLPAS